MDLGLGLVVSLKDTLSGTAPKVARSMEKLDGTVARTSESMTRNLARIQKGAMMAGVGVAMLAAPVALLTATAETQKALGELASLGVQDLRALENAAESFSNQWAGTTKAQFITSAYDVRSALANLSDEAVGTFTSMAALTGKATKATTDEMVGTFTTAYGIYKPIMAEMSDMVWAETFAGAMAQTVASFKTNGKQMSDAIKNIGAIASSANIPLQEQLAILGQLQTTMPGSEAGTLYKAFIMKAAEAGDKLGVTMTDANGRLLGIVPMMEAIRRKFPDMTLAATQVEIKKAFGSDEAVKFLLQMSQGLDGLRENIQSVKHAMDTGTAVTQKMARAMNRDIGASLEVIRQQLSNLMEILGRTLIPIVSPLIALTTNILIGLQKVVKNFSGLAQVVLVVASALGAFLVVAGGVVAGLGAIGLAIPAIKAGIAGFGAALAGAGTAIATYFLPVTLAVAGVVAIMVALRKAWQNDLGGIRTTIEKTVGRIRLAFQGVRSLIRSLKDGTGQLSADLATRLENAGLMGFVTGFFQAFYRVRQFFVGFGQALVQTGQRVQNILGPAIRALVSAYGSLVKSALSVFEIFGMVTNSADSSVFLEYGRVLGSVLGVILEVGAFILKLIVYPLSWALRLVSVVGKAFLWVGKIVVGALVNGARALYTYFLPLRLVVQAIRLVSRVAYGLWGILSGGTSVVGGFKSIAAAIGDFLLTPFRWAWDVLQGFWTMMKSLVSSMANLFLSIGDLLLRGLKASPLFGPIFQLFDLAGNLYEKRALFFDAGKSWLLALAEGIWSAVTAPYQRLKQGLTKLRELLPWSQSQPTKHVPIKTEPITTTNAPTFTVGRTRPPEHPALIPSVDRPTLANLPTAQIANPIQRSPIPDPVSISTAMQSTPRNNSVQTIEQSVSMLPEQTSANIEGLTSAAHAVRNTLVSGINTAANRIERLWQIVKQPVRLVSHPLSDSLSALRALLPEKLALITKWGAGQVPRTLAASLMLTPALAGALPTAGFARIESVFSKPTPQTQAPKTPSLVDQVWRINPEVSALPAIPRPNEPWNISPVVGTLSDFAHPNGLVVPITHVAQAAKLPSKPAAPAQRKTSESGNQTRLLNPILTGTPVPKVINGGIAVFQRVLVGTLEANPSALFHYRNEQDQNILHLQPDIQIPKTFHGVLVLAQRLMERLPTVLYSKWMITGGHLPPTAPHPVPNPVKADEPNAEEIALQRRRQLLQVHHDSAPEKHERQTVEFLKPLLEDLVRRVETMTQRPIQITLKTELDGREIAEAVYKDIREQKVKRYETFS